MAHRSLVVLAVALTAIGAARPQQSPGGTQPSHAEALGAVTFRQLVRSGGAGGV